MCAGLGGAVSNLPAELWASLHGAVLKGELPEELGDSEHLDNRCGKVTVLLLHGGRSRSGIDPERDDVLEDDRV